MAVKNGQLTCVYNLGEHETELQVDQILTESETQDAVMDRVKFQRYKSDRLPFNLTDTHQTSIVHVAEPHFQYRGLDFFHFYIDFYITLLSNLFFNRIYQFARLNYTTRATSSKPETLQPHDMDNGNSNTLLNLDPENVVFYVGGYPVGFKVSANVISLNENT